MSKNAEGWIRHRGGKCPVEASVKVDYRMRDGEIDDFGRKSETLDWAHYSEIGDIMAYKLHKPAEQVDGGIYSADDSVSTEQVAVSYIGESVQGPLQWRDRIAEIDATTQALTAARAELVQKLASEGFALIGLAQGALIGLPRNEWKVGDLVVRVMGGEESVMPLNEPMKITFFDGSDRGQDVEVGGKYFPKVSSLRWHSRPSA